MSAGRKPERAGLAHLDATFSTRSEPHGVRDLRRIEHVRL